MKLKTFIILVLTIPISIYLLLNYNLIQHPRYVPNIATVDLSPLLEKDDFTTDDYTILFEQTGLTQPIIDELRTMPNFTEKMLRFQQDYLKEVAVTVEYLPPLTLSDMLTETSEPGFQLAPYHNGYILLSKSTYTGAWRHGHAGIVIDDVRGIVLEALYPGSNSMEQPISKWQYFPTFKMMRLKDVPQSTLDEIADYAATYLIDLPYNILADKVQGDAPTSTHCSLLIWQAFMPFGYDLDATGELFVSPQNLAASPYLELLQIYGFDPDKDW